MLKPGTEQVEGFRLDAARCEGAETVPECRKEPWCHHHATCPMKCGDFNLLLLGGPLLGLVLGQDREQWEEGRIPGKALASHGSTVQGLPVRVLICSMFCLLFCGSSFLPFHSLT